MSPISVIICTVLLFCKVINGQYYYKTSSSLVPASPHNYCFAYPVNYFSYKNSYMNTANHNENKLIAENKFFPYPSKLLPIPAYSPVYLVFADSKLPYLSPKNQNEPSLFDTSKYSTACKTYSPSLATNPYYSYLRLMTLPNKNTLESSNPNTLFSSHNPSGTNAPKFYYIPKFNIQSEKIPEHVAPSNRQPRKVEMLNIPIEYSKVFQTNPNSTVFLNSNRDSLLSISSSIPLFQCPFCSVQEKEKNNLSLSPPDSSKMPGLEDKINSDAKSEEFNGKAEENTNKLEILSNNEAIPKESRYDLLLLEGFLKGLGLEA